MFSARDELRRSPHLDKAADTAAVAAGQPLPTERLEARAREAITLAHRRFEASSQAYQDAQVACRGSSKCPIWVTRCRGPPRIRHGGLWADPNLLRNGPDRSRSRALASGPPDP
jgi:hypothetical protein